MVLIIRVMSGMVIPNKLAAIKAVREIGGYGLKESKEMIDSIVFGDTESVRVVVSEATSKTVMENAIDTLKDNNIEVLNGLDIAGMLESLIVAFAAASRIDGAHILIHMRIDYTNNPF